MVMWQIQRQYFPTKLPFQQFNLFYHYYHNTICLGFLTDVKGGKIMTIIVTVTVLLVRWHLRTKHPIFFYVGIFRRNFSISCFFGKYFVEEDGANDDEANDLLTPQFSKTMAETLLFILAIILFSNSRNSSVRFAKNPVQIAIFCHIILK